MSRAFTDHAKLLAASQAPHLTNARKQRTEATRLKTEAPKEASGLEQARQASWTGVRERLATQRAGARAASIAHASRERKSPLRAARWGGVRRRKERGGTRHARYAEGVVGTAPEFAHGLPSGIVRKFGVVFATNIAHRSSFDIANERDQMVKTEDGGTSKHERTNTKFQLLLCFSVEFL